MITGNYSDGGQQRGFVRASDGTITITTTFDPTGSTGTTPLGINDSGVITGFYFVGGQQRGFVRASDGTITTFDPPGSVQTIPEGINDSGVITGFYSDGGQFRGFVRASDGTFTSFDPPGSTQTIPQGINDSGVITGYYAGGGQLRGFVLVVAEPCLPGTFSDTGAEPCIPAPRGTFTSVSGATAATPCPVGFTTAGEGSTSSDDCTPVESDRVVTRIGGATRIDTAIDVSQSGFGPDAAGAVVLARSDLYPDALVGGPFAALTNAPLLLTPSDVLPATVLAEIDRVLPAGATVYVLGGIVSVEPAGRVRARQRRICRGAIGGHGSFRDCHQGC